MRMDKRGKSNGYCSVVCLNASGTVAERLSKKGLERYSDPEKKAEIFKKRMATNLAKYGCEHVLQIPGKAKAASSKGAVKRNRSMELMRQRRLAETGMLPQQQQSGWTIETVQKLGDRTYLDGLISQKLTLGQMAERIGCSPSTVSNTIERLGIERPKLWCSAAEGEIASFISSLDPTLKVVRNDRLVFNNRMELDLYIPEKNLAIEHHGIFWHATDGLDPKKRYRNREKYLACRETGIHLIQLFEDEWQDRRSICESMIAQRLGLGCERFVARDTETRRIDASEAGKFMDRCHIAGAAKCSCAYGLYDRDRLLSVMTFSRNRFKQDGWEIIRFASELRTYVVGGASKLFNAFRTDHPVECVSTYADLRFGSGQVYEKLGFSPKGTTRPGYFWFYCGRRIHRYLTQKRNLPKLLGDKFDPVKTEDENMRAVGALKLFDAGHARYHINCLHP